MAKEEKKATPPPTDLRTVASKEVQTPVAKKASLKDTYATLWQNASGKKCDPNEKDSKGIPVLEKYYRNWVNAE